jgi:hypothetical protein
VIENQHITYTLPTNVAYTTTRIKRNSKAIPTLQRGSGEELKKEIGRN